MERIAIEKLIKWKDSPRRKPLVIEGARQVGKTWLVKEFAQRNYKQLAYVNFEDMKILQNLFVQDFDIPRILTAIGATTHVTCTEGDTLIFLDEIQAAPNAITSLKYFCENAPGYHVIAAGSLLGIELHQGESFPVGKVQFLNLYPMSFIEFVMAMGEENLAKLLQTKDWNMIQLFAPKFQELLKYYYYVGGMPEAVLSFSQNRDWLEVREIQNEILKSYHRDISKHAPSGVVPRISDLWNSIPAQLSKENRKLCKTYYGHSPIIYCSESYFKDYLSPEFDGYYLWIASYNHEPVLPGEPHYDIWQFSRHGRVPGVWNWVDLNRFADGRTLDDIRIKE